MPLSETIIPFLSNCGKEVLKSGALNVALPIAYIHLRELPTKLL
jgi:hypothetical protein